MKVENMKINKAIKIVKDFEKRFLLNEVGCEEVKHNMNDITLNYVNECAFINHKTDEEIIEKAIYLNRNK